MLVTIAFRDTCVVQLQIVQICAGFLRAHVTIVDYLTCTLVNQIPEVRTLVYGYDAIRYLSGENLCF